MLWHRQIEKKNVRFQLSRELYGLGAITGLTDDLKIRLRLQEASQTIPEDRVVIGNNNPDGLRSSVIHRHSLAAAGC